MTSASTILQTAADIVSGDRQRVHGPAREDFGKIAALWTAYNAIRRSAPGPYTSADATLMMSLLKVARSQCGEFNADDFVDMAGYAGIAGEIAGRQSDGPN